MQILWNWSPCYSETIKICYTSPNICWISTGCLGLTEFHLFFLRLLLVTNRLMCWSTVDEWKAIGCYNNFDHCALPVHFYTPTDLDVNELWPNLKPLAKACSKQAEIRNYSCFGIQYQHECWGGNFHFQMEQLCVFKLLWRT